MCPPPWLAICPLRNAFFHDVSVRRVSEEEAVAREAALQAAGEEFLQQQTKAIAIVRPKKILLTSIYLAANTHDEAR